MANEVASKDTVNVNRDDYDAMRDRINELEDDGTSHIYDTLNKPVNKTGWLWVAPEYFSRWRIFPRCFISMYIYLLYFAAAGTDLSNRNCFDFAEHLI